MPKLLLFRPIFVGVNFCSKSKEWRMRYKITDGRVQTRALEYHIVDHCNLHCDQCCSFSPILPKWACDPETFRKDLLKIKTALAPQFLKIVGGEPLLHPRLVELLTIA